MKLGQIGSVAMAVFAAFWMQACGSSAGAGSCNVTNTAAAGYTFCINYIGSNYTSSAVQNACTQESGTYSSGACATGTSGSCDFQHGTASEYKWTYSIASDAGSVSLQSICATAGGTYSAT
jgi:hypothetical protein